MPFTMGEYLNGSGLVVANNIVIVAVGRCRPNGKKVHHENKNTGSYDRTKMAVLYDIIVEVFTPNPVIEDVGSVFFGDGWQVHHKYHKVQFSIGPTNQQQRKSFEISRNLG